MGLCLTLTKFELVKLYCDTIVLCQISVGNWTGDKVRLYMCFFLWFLAKSINFSSRWIQYFNSLPCSSPSGFSVYDIEKFFSILKKANFLCSCSLTFCRSRVWGCVWLFNFFPVKVGLVYEVNQWRQWGFLLLLCFDHVVSVFLLAVWWLVVSLLVTVGRPFGKECSHHDLFPCSVKLSLPLPKIGSLMVHVWS